MTEIGVWLDLQRQNNDGNNNNFKIIVIMVSDVLVGFIGFLFLVLVEFD
jgi:hypothetical protein